VVVLQNIYAGLSDLEILGIEPAGEDGAMRFLASFVAL
jgi:hypothetical protein